MTALSSAPQSSDRLHRRVRARASQHYVRVMPQKPSHRAAIWAVFWVAAGVIAVQLMYPPTRAVPTAMIGETPEAWQHEIDLAAEITSRFEKTAVKLELEGETIDVPLGTLGAAPETAAMVQALTEYPFWQRYVPFSLFMQLARLDTATVTYTNHIAQAKCEELAKKLSVAPTNARLEFVEGKLVASDDVPGRRVDPQQLCRHIQSHDVPLGGTTTITVPSSVTAPSRTSADFAPVRAAAEQALARNIVFTYDGERYDVPRATLASWLLLSEDNRGQTVLRVDSARVQAYLEMINTSIGRSAGTTNVRIVNGREVSREVGETGSRIDYKLAVSAAEAQLLGDQLLAPISLELVDVAPTVVYNSRYTASEAGLQAYVNDAARDYNARIMVRQLGQEGWEAAARQNESIPSASTYKLYVAMWLFDQMEQGKTHWNAPMLDTTVSVCFDRMTIASTNACAEEWLAHAGRDNMNRYLYERGISRGTTFTSPIATHTTAADLTNHMTKLARGELYPDTYRQRLYQSLRTHPYRYGVAAGSAGEVYDKVGFLWDYVHDTAIVKHPRGDYVVTIMTKGQSYARIASITREIERIMYP